MSDIESNHGIGYTFPATPVAYNQRDLLLYAAGVGAKMSEPRVSYELHPEWAPLPTYPVVLPFKNASSDVVNFAELMSGSRAVPGLPQTNGSRAPPTVHADQAIEVFKVLPHKVDESEGWTLKKQLTGVFDSGKGLRVEQTTSLIDGKGTEYARMTSTSYTAGDWGLNKFNKSIAPKPPVEALAKPPSREPDAVIKETPPYEVSVVYRLSGDYNPLHIDPNVGKAIFGGTINHGLCAYGYCCRHLISAMADGQPSRLVYLKARFASPVKPGDTLETRMWRGDKLADGRQVVHYVQMNNGKPALGGGVALIAPADSTGKSKL